MLMPSIFGENLFDDFFGDFPFYYDDRAMKDTEKKLYGRRASHIMKTDIKETDKIYLMTFGNSHFLITVKNRKTLKRNCMDIIVKI